MDYPIKIDELIIIKKSIFWDHFIHLYFFKIESSLLFSALPRIFFKIFKPCGWPLSLWYLIYHSHILIKFEIRFHLYPYYLIMHKSWWSIFYYHTLKYVCKCNIRWHLNCSKRKSINSKGVSFCLNSHSCNFIKLTYQIILIVLKLTKV